MPAGVTWGAYLRFSVAAFLSMIAGSQTVHVLYKPLEEMERLVDEEVKKIQKELVDALEKGDVKIKGVTTAKVERI